MNQDVFLSQPIVEVENYKLKPIDSSDLKEIEELCSYYPPERRISATDLLEKINQEYIDKNGINWGIYLKNELIGTIGFYRGFDKSEGELGYVLRSAHRNKGIGSICAEAIIKIGLELMELKAIEAYTAIENLASQKLLEKVGFKRIKHPNKKTAAYRIEV